MMEGKNLSVPIEPLPQRINSHLSWCCSFASKWRYSIAFSLP